MSYNNETGMYEGYIYKVTNKINLHMYIGQTLRTIEDRWKEHVKDAKGQVDEYYFHRAIRKYGKDSFLVEQIELLTDNTVDELKKQLNKREKYYIHLFNTYNPCGYNGSIGGEGCCIRAIDHYSLDKKFLCQYDSITSAYIATGLSMGHIVENCNGINLGTRCGFFRYAGEPLDKFDTIYRPNGAIRINKFNLDGEIVSSYKSVTDICNEYNVTRRIACSWKDKHLLIDNQYVFFLETEDFDYNKITVPFISKIDVFDLNMNYIRTFNSQSEAGRILCLDNSSISKCCLGKISHVKNYIFRKVEWNI